MKEVILILTYFIIQFQINFQKNDFKKYVDSFNNAKTSSIVEFRDIVNTGVQMSKKEALKFVYFGDTSKLYCLQKSFNEETEEISDVRRVIFLPYKCIKFDMGKYFLIAYSSFECYGDVTKLTLSIVTKGYQVKDSLVVYKGNNYDLSLDGLFNPQNGKIFLYKLKKDQNRQALIYEINDKILNFRIVSEKNNVSGNLDNLNGILEKLGWYEIFSN